MKLLCIPQNFSFHSNATHTGWGPAHRAFKKTQPAQVPEVVFLDSGTAFCHYLFHTEHMAYIAFLLYRKRAVRIRLCPAAPPASEAVM